MILQWPFMLPLLILVPVLLAVYIWMQRRRQRYALRYASLSLLREAVGSGPGIKRHIPPALFLLSLAAMIFALARPLAEVEVPSFNGTVILAMDVSGSMRADDLQPNRLQAAKNAARAFVAAQPGDVRIGVVAFSGFAALVQAPTNERNQVLAAIDQLEPQRSTAIGEGLMASIHAIDPQAVLDMPPGAGVQGLPGAGRQPPADPGTRAQPGNSGAAPAAGAAGNGNAPASGNQGIIVLLSDGQNTIGADPLDVAPQARALGIRVYTVGIGTAQGSVLRSFGRAMRVRLDEATLRSVADMTGGQYFNAQNEQDLRSIYQNLVRQFGVRVERTELTAYVTAVAAALALAGGLLSLLWFNRLP